MRSGGSGTRSARVRCAIYTRKSSEEGLEQEFNSLQAQREACEAFISSQRHEGWVCRPACYDDGGFSGATMDRPALQRLLARRFCQDRRDPRCEGRLVCLGHAAVQHDDLDGAPDPQCSVVLCSGVYRVVIPPPETRADIVDIGQRIRCSAAPNSYSNALIQRAILLGARATPAPGLDFCFLSPKGVRRDLSSAAGAAPPAADAGSKRRRAESRLVRNLRSNGTHQPQEDGSRTLGQCDAVAPNV